MNFLLHRHLAAEELGSPLAGVGAMLPDLWRIADRRVRAIREPECPADQPEVAELFAGIAHHLRLDAWFHRAPVFIEGESVLQRELRALDFQADRMPLFAHVLWELCLDGALLHKVGYETTMAALRSGFPSAIGLSIETGPAARAATLHHFSRIDRGAAGRQLFDERLARIMSELERGPWVSSYRSAAGIALGISGVRARVGLPVLQGDDHSRLTDALEPALARARSALDEVLAHPA